VVKLILVIFPLFLLTCGLLSNIFHHCSMPSLSTTDL
jgi:hypothetical protein